MNAKTKFFTACAAAMMASLLMAVPSFAQTKVPPTPPPVPTLAQELATPEPIATLEPLDTPEPIATPAPLGSTEDDRRILNGDRTITGDNFVLRSNETLRGDLSVLGGNVVLEEGSRVEGQLNVIGGNADVAGTIESDVSVVGGTVNLRSSAEVGGDLIKLGGTINRNPGARVSGRETSARFPTVTSPANNEDREHGPLQWFINVVTSAVATFFGIVFITLFALAFAALLPSNLVKSAAVAVSQWGMSGVVGALTLIAVPIVIGVLAITICLIPVAFVLLIAYVVAILAGWVVSARIVGERLMSAINRHGWTLVGQVAAGAILLALLGAIPVLGGIIGFLAASLGLGALILTRFGTRDYPMPRSMALVPTGPIPPAGGMTGTAWPVEPEPPVTPVSPTPPTEPPVTPVSPVTSADTPPPPPPPFDAPPADEPK